MSKIKVGKLSKSISEELDNSSDVHDFKLAITCADSSSATQLESLVKKNDGKVDAVIYDAHLPEVEVHVVFTKTLMEYLTLCDELSGLGRDKWYFNAITDCEVLK
jgi:hypothetical protein